MTELTREGLDALLSSLDADDREMAGKRYETIRGKLVRLFEWRGCESPEALADKTMNRVAQRLAGGVVPTNLYGYFYGVAHLVHKEEARRAAREQRALDAGGWPPPQHGDEPDDRRLDYIRKCLERLPPDQRRLILEYYRGDDNIRARKALCQELGDIPINALRIRVHRVRRKLESCVQECLRT